MQASENSTTSISLQHSSPEVVQLATNYASDYLNYVENLPFDLQRNVTKLREVDQRCREYVKEIETLYESFMKENDGSTGVKKRTYLLQIRRLFGLCKELGDEKIAIAQGMSETIEMRNKQLEHGCRRFRLSYDPNIKLDHNGKKDKEVKSESAKGHKRSRRQRNNHMIEKHEKVQHLHKEKDQEKTKQTASHHSEDPDEPPAKIMAASSPEHSAVTVPTPALTRAAQRDEDKRLSNKSSKEKKEEKQQEKVEEQVSTTTSSSSNKTTTESSSATLIATTTTPSTPSTPSSKQTKITSTSASSSSTNTANKSANKGKKKKRKSNKHQTEKQSSNTGEVSPIIDMPIDPDEPTYCLCQQVSFGQMIGCDNMKCPIEWFHFSCVRLTHKPKGKWFCPDCTIKRKREGKRGDNR